MEPSVRPPGEHRRRVNPLLFYIILAIIIASIVAFLIFHPRPSNASTTPNPANPPTATLGK